MTEVSIPLQFRLGKYGEVKLDIPTELTEEECAMALSNNVDFDGLTYEIKKREENKEK